MATIEQEQNQRNALAAKLSELSAIKADDLVREDMLGRSLSFAGGVKYFDRTLRLFRNLSKVNLDEIPFTRLTQLATVLDEALNQFNAIKNFSIEQQTNPMAQRDQLMNQVRDTYDRHFDVISPVIAYSVQKGTDFEKLENDARNSVTQLVTYLDGEKQRSEGLLREILDTQEKVRRAAQEVGVAQHSVHFAEEAKQHQKAATQWLWSAGALAVLTIIAGVAAVFVYLTKLPSLPTQLSVQVALAKLMVFSVLFSGLVAAGRIYRAHRHNYVVNKHRQNALSTFETFASAAADEQTKNAVLLQATQCIFSPQHTGYVSHEDSGGNPPFMEILGGIVGTSPRK